jgi:hypothetical protein
MWGIATKKIGRVAVKEQGESVPLLFDRSQVQKQLNELPRLYFPGYARRARNADCFVE